MKKILSLSLILLVSHGAFSQNTEEYVEVIVSDTVQAEPEEIIYTLYSYENDQTSEVTEKLSGKPGIIQKPAKKEETVSGKIRNVIKAQNIDTVEATRYTFENEMYGGNYKNIFNLRFVSREKLEAFLDAIHGIKGVTGFISDKRTSKTDMLNQVLMNRLLQKAAAGAGLIAAQTGRTLGKLTQVREENLDESRGGWTVYPPLSALAQTDYGNTSAKIIIAKKIVVRYLW